MHIDLTKSPITPKRQKLRRDIVVQARDIGSRAENITDTELEDLLGEAFGDLGRRV